MLAWPEYVQLFTGLLAMFNPVTTAVIFIALTESRPPRECRKIAVTAALASGVTLAVADFAGESILHAFGITIPSFRIAGGILILMTSLVMLGAKQPVAGADKDDPSKSVAVVPLAIPISAGPGSISMIILFSARTPSLTHDLLILIPIALVCLILMISLFAAPALTAKVGPSGMDVVTKVMGLLLAALAIEFIAGGIGGLWPHLAAGG